MRKSVPLSILTLILSTVIFWISCGKSNSGEECLSCKAVPPKDFKNINLVSNSLPVGIYERNPYPNLVLAKSQLETKESSLMMQELIGTLDDNLLNTLMQEKYVPVNYNFFVKKNLRTHDEINKEDISGFNVFMYKDFGLHHFMFLKNESGNFAIHTKYSTTTNSLNYSDKYLVFERLINNDIDSFSLITMVVPPFMEIQPRVKTKNKLRQILT